MKKIYTLSFFLMMGFVVNSFAQSLNVSTVAGQAFPFHKNSQTTFANDTLVPPTWNMPCGDSVFFYSFQAPATGFVFGNNSYGETECAQRYNFVSGTISEVLVWYAHTAGSTGSTTAKLYSINGTTKAPQTALGSSAAVTTGSIATTGYTSYTFSSAVTVSSGFYAAVVFPTTTGDSVGVRSFKFGCSTPDSLSWLNIPSFGGWNAVSGLFPAPNNNTDIIILPIGAVNSGVNEYSSAGLSLLGAYPNPAQNESSIRYSVKDNSMVSVKVFDLTGNTVFESSDEVASGSHEIKLNVKDLAAGTYYYTITTSTSSLSSKFSVVK